MSKAIGRGILCIYFFVFITLAIGVGVGVHTEAVVRTTTGLPDPIFENYLIWQFQVIYGPAIVAVAFFLSALVAFTPRPLTIVLAGGLSVLILFTSPFPASEPGVSLTAGSFMTFGSFLVINYHASQSANATGGERDPSTIPAAPSPEAVHTTTPKQRAISANAPNGEEHPSTFPTTPSPKASPMTPQERAIKLFPDLAFANSKLNQEFIRRYRQYQKEKSAFFNDPEWPTALARECQAAIITR